ncbi:hypothetical protein EAF04_005449 [Stromatinia cepivora]|nr:hypothetical protein EAF04_005449 [Stromatinia cepivora]
MVGAGLSDQDPTGLDTTITSQSILVIWDSPQSLITTHLRITWKGKLMAGIPGQVDGTAAGVMATYGEGIPGEKIVIDLICRNQTTLVEYERIMNTWYIYKIFQVDVGRGEIGSKKRRFSLIGTGWSHNS